MDKTRDFRDGDRVIVRNRKAGLDAAHEGQTGRFLEYSHPRRYARIQLDGDSRRTNVLIHPEDIELLVAAPEPKPSPGASAAAGTMISTLPDLCRHFGAEDPDELSASISKASKCDAWISVQLPDGSWRRGAEGVRRVIAFRLGSFVEGSDEEFACAPLTLPCKAADVDAAIARLQAETSTAAAPKRKLAADERQ